MGRIAAELRRQAASLAALDRCLWFLLGATGLEFAYVVARALVTLPHLRIPRLRDAPEFNQYPEFVSGVLAFSGANKSADYILLTLSFLLAAAGTLALALLFTGFLWRHPDAGWRDAVREHIILAQLPAACGLALSLFGDFDWLFAVASICATAGVPVLLEWTDGIPADRLFAEADSFTKMAYWLPLLLAADHLAFQLAVTRVFHRKLLVLLPVHGVVAVFLGSWLVLWMLSRLRSNPGRMAGAARGVMFALQLPLPLLYFALVPPAWRIDGSAVTAYPVKGGIWLLTGCLATAGVASVLRAAVSRKPASTLRALALAGLVVYAAVPFIPAPMLSSDDFHTGETLNPAFQFLDFGKRPFLDLETIHGVCDFATGVSVRLLFGGAAAMEYGRAVVTGLIAMVLFLLLQRVAPTAAALGAAVLLTRAPSLAAHGPVLITAALLAPPGLTRRPAWWLLVWVTTGYANVLYHHSTGVAFVLASLPFTAYMTLRAAREERWKSAAVPVLALAALLAAILATPLLPATVALIRFLWENSSIHLIANAIAWTPWSRGLLPVGTEATIFQSVAFANLYRFLWIVPALGGIVWLARRVAGEPGGRTGIWLASLAALIGLPLMPYSYGRVNPVGLGRPESVTFVCGALAVFLLIVTCREWRPGRLAASLALALVAAAPGAVGWNLSQSWESAIRFSEMSSKTYGEMSSHGIPALGPALAEDRGHLAGLVEVKAILGKHLRAGETFLDLTDRPALYTYFGFPTPMRWTCGYHVVKESWQKRAIEDLEKTRPPLVIVDFANYRPDASSLALRSYWLYRWIVEQYTPARIGAYGFLLRPDRAVEAGALPRDEQLAVLDRAFAQTELGFLPVAWGRSWQRLASHTRRRSVLTVVGGPEETKLTVPPADNISGKEAALLKFDFHCEGQSARPRLVVTWAFDGETQFESRALRFAAGEGPILAPLDHNPRWLFGGRLTHLAVRMEDPNACASYSLANAELLARRAPD